MDADLPPPVTPALVRQWFFLGRERGFDRLLIIYDDFDGSTYHKYVQANDPIPKPADMQRVTEIFDLKGDFDSQYAAIFPQSIQGMRDIIRRCRGQEPPKSA